MRINALPHNQTVPTIIFGSSNDHKVVEVQTILKPYRIHLIGLDDYKQPLTTPEETADTFEGNAQLKAISYAKQTGMICLADDSGLEVDALFGAPGIHSARWATPNGEGAQRDQANNRKLIQQLLHIPVNQRAARFVCTMCLATPKGEILAESRGHLEGVITLTPRGTHGFGYDPLLFIPELGRTTAELNANEKNDRSHRGKATRAIAKLIQTLPEFTIQTSHHTSLPNQ